MLRTARAPNAELLEELKGFFFEAMLHSWAAGGSSAQHPDLPGMKTISYERPGLRMTELWTSSALTPKFAGTVYLWMNQDPLWVMHFEGEYDRPAIPFLKKVLSRTYREKKFLGGRGPQKLCDASEQLIYANEINASSFAAFDGAEYILSMVTGNRCGSMRYRGMALF